MYYEMYTLPLLFSSYYVEIIWMPGVQLQI